MTDLPLPDAPTDSPDPSVSASKSWRSSAISAIWIWSSVTWRSKPGRQHSRCLGDAPSSTRSGSGLSMVGSGCSCWPARYLHACLCLPYPLTLKLFPQAQVFCPSAGRRFAGFFAGLGGICQDLRLLSRYLFFRLMSIDYIIGASQLPSNSEACQSIDIAL